MKTSKTILIKLLLTALVFASLPAYSFAETSSLTKKDGDLCFEMGKSYDLTIGQYDDICLCTDDFDELESAVSSDSSVAFCEVDDDPWEGVWLSAIKPGSATLTIKDSSDRETTINLTVNKESPVKETLSKSSDVTYIFPGYAYSLTIYTSDTPVFSYGGRAWTASRKSSNTKVATCKVIDYEDEYDVFQITPKKAGKTTITVKDEFGKSCTIKLTVKQAKSTIKATGYVYKNSKKVTVKATNVVKGDIIKLKIGNKTYKRR